MAIKEHKIINLKNVNTGIMSSFSLGRMWADEDDWANGGYVDLDGATNIYDFCRRHPGEQFLIQGLEGLQFNISPEKKNGIFWADSEKTEQIPQFTVSIRCPMKGGTTYQLDVEVYPSGTVTDAHKFWVSGWSTVDIPGTTGIHQCFVWNETENQLSLVGSSYKIMAASIGYEITVELNRKTFRDFGRFQWIPVVSGIKQIIPVLENFGTDPNSLNNVWRFMFHDYKQLNQDDKDDDDKQKPIEWAYPNGPGGPSKPGGGNGNQEDTSDPIPEDDIIEGLSSDFVKLYKITKANLTALSEYMLKDDFLTNIKKLYADPMDAIISLNTFPINATGTAGVITTSGVSTGINAIQINNSIIDIDCGIIAMQEYWGSFLDYETKISLFLPYVGIQPISTDDFMNDIIHVVYRVDLLSGGFVVFVKNSKGIVHQTTGNMAYHMPVTSIDYSRMYASLITGAVGLAGAAVTGGASIAAAKTATAAFAAKEAFVGSAITTGTNTMQNFHPQIQMSGNFGGNTGICSNKKPYLIIERPVPNVPSNYSAIKGNTSNVTVTLGNCSGFTQVSDMQIKYISATDAEKTQILNLLTSGVYF